MADCECSVCYEGFTTAEGAKTSVVTLSCGHPFHFACITKWFSGKAVPSCPMCRKGMVGLDAFDGDYHENTADGEFAAQLEVSAGHIAADYGAEAAARYRARAVARHAFRLAREAEEGATAAVVEAAVSVWRAGDQGAWNQLTVDDFKGWLRLKRLPIGGTRAVVAARVHAAMGGAAVGAT
jgi:hypothetical protein